MFPCPLMSSGEMNMKNESKEATTAKTVNVKNLLDAMNITAVIEKGVNEALSSKEVIAACKDMEGLRRYMQTKSIELTMTYIGKFAEIYTEEEINALVAFHCSPAGKGIVQKSHLLARMVEEMNKTQMQQIEQAVMQFM